MVVREKAPAKINLALHVTGKRADGFHLLESVVTFSATGDIIEIEAAGDDSFSMSGRFSDGLSRFADGENGNLVLKARDYLRDAAIAAGYDAPAVHIHLEKNLPVASGIGGGSADAAAVLRALLKLWNARLDGDVIDALSLKLGADVPMCFAGRPLLAAGVGEQLTLLPAMPSFHCILANPLVPVSTPQVFRALEKRDNPSIGEVPQHSDSTDWLSWFASLRNDLEPPARKLETRIAELSGLMQDSGAKLVRMSGSGASCFALYETAEHASIAYETLQLARPQWFFMQTETRAGGDCDGRN